MQALSLTGREICMNFFAILATTEVFVETGLALSILAFAGSRLAGKLLCSVAESRPKLMVDYNSPLKSSALLRAALTLVLVATRLIVISAVDTKMPQSNGRM